MTDAANRVVRRGITAALLMLPGLMSACAAPAADVVTNPAAAAATAPLPTFGKPPALPGVVVLFSGKEDEIAQNWLQQGTDRPANWPFADGAMTATGTDIVTKQLFTDFQLHVEFRIPYMPNAHGQARGNSGVYLQGRYEIQVLDSYGIKSPGSGDCGAVYNQSAPLINACKPPLEWQAYDIIFRAPRFDPETHKQTEPPRVSVYQNGIAVQNNTIIQGRTVASMDTDPSQPGPLMLQYHGNPVSYRNVWILPLPLHGAEHY